ncbi:MAG: hypothetical protein AAGI92_07755 [Pseudomonadota bacterium]
MKPVLKLTTVLALAGALTTTASAQEKRYTIERTDDGYVRLDTETGQMSVCEFSGDQLICKMAADDRAAYDANISDLEDRVAALEQRIGEGGTSSDLPSEDEFEQTMNYMERFMRRFMGIVEDFASDGERSPESTPDRT